MRRQRAAWRYDDIAGTYADDGGRRHASAATPTTVLHLLSTRCLLWLAARQRLSIPYAKDLRRLALAISPLYSVRHCCIHGSVFGVPMLFRLAAKRFCQHATAGILDPVQLHSLWISALYRPTLGTGALNCGISISVRLESHWRAVCLQ